MGIVLERGFGKFQLAEAFNVYLFVGVHQDVSHCIVFEIGFQRPKAQHLVFNVAEELFSFIEIERDDGAILFQYPAHQRFDLGFQRVAIYGVDQGEVDDVQHPAVYPVFQLEIGVGYSLIGRHGCCRGDQRCGDFIDCIFLGIEKHAYLRAPVYCIPSS